MVIWFAFTQTCAFASGSVTLAWMPSEDTSVAGYNLYYGSASGVYDNTIQAANTTNTIVSGLVEGVTYYFAATAYDDAGVESPFSNETSYQVPISVANNNPPTLNGLGDLNINANAGLQTVNLSGITAGTGENQPLTVTAVSSNPSLIPSPAVNYASANSTGTLNFTPTTDATGTATITVTVNDGQAQNNTFSSTFTVTVNAAAIVANNPPTLNAPGNLTINANSGLQTVSLSGITCGAGENQALTVTAVSSNPSLIPTPTITYASPAAAGSLKFTSANNASGTATITVTVNDGQAQNNTFSRSFTVLVNPVNQSPTLNPISDFFVTKNAGIQTVALSGISAGLTVVSSSTANKKQPPKIRITATSSNTKLLSNPKVHYSGQGSAGSLTFKPVKNASGTTTVTVMVNNGAQINNLTKKTFTVTVLDPGQTPATLTPAVPVSKESAQRIQDSTAMTMPATLNPAAHASGQFALTITGSVGREYIVQASTDMVNWVPVQTNTVPFTFTDTQAGQFSQRFYRSVSVP